MNHDQHTFRTPILTIAGMILALGLWVFWSWQGYSERSLEWRRQRAQDSFDTMNAVVASLANGELTDWQQVENVLGSITRNSRILFVVIQDRHGRLAQTGTAPDFLMSNSTQGERLEETMYVFWAPLRPMEIPISWSEALNIPHLGLWPSGTPVMYLGFRPPSEPFASSWFWRREGPIFLSALVCILAFSAVWVASLRRRSVVSQLAAERIRSAHLEELALAAAGLAHETKNPLGIIMGMAQQIASRPNIPPDSRAMLEQIIDEVDKTTSRLGSFMNFARQRTANLAPVDLFGLCSEVVQALKPEFDSGGVYVQVAVHPVRILADGTMVRQILVNLLLNSLRASNPGTTVFVRTNRHRRKLQLMVEDKGCGISPELLPNIFKPYTSGTAAGHGLGLAIVKRMVDAHGWRINASSTPGQGTIMTISGIKPAEEEHA